MNPGIQNTPPDLPLRDIHLPDAISWWPPAPGWWILALLILAVTGAGLYWYARTTQRRRLLQAMKSELRQIEHAYARHQDDLRLANALSVLLRRVAISTAPRESTASLTGEAWLDYLDSGVAGQEFSTGVGRCLPEAPSHPATSIDGPALLKLCGQWIAGRKVPGQV